jgi:hypothetical protein
VSAHLRCVAQQALAIALVSTIRRLELEHRDGDRPHPPSVSLLEGESQLRLGETRSQMLNYQSVAKLVWDRDY